ncbi:Smr/MutS family protein [Acidithiobacillus sp. IBUN Pt1247-S3]|uniref:endonuclease MutS2 n=1 Tax=Acidithiobacillus sp. IBUN Pt1247-S3 TaxID=3166642 RepID=UPI0034E397FA
MDAGIAAHEAPDALRLAAQTALELPLLCQYWLDRCVHVYAKRHVLSLDPWIPVVEIKQRLARSAALQRRLADGPGLPSTELPDIVEILTLASRPGALLSGIELLRVRRVLEMAAGYARFLQPIDDFLFGDAEILTPNPILLGRLRDSLDLDGVLLDQASPELARLRQQLRVQRAQVQQQLQGLLRERERREIWQDPHVVQRRGRFLLPVKANFKGRLRGIVHDRSASGETLFIEPLGVVEQNNLLVELEAAQRQEEERILRGLTTLLGSETERLLLTLERMGRLEAIRAGLELAAVWGGSIPAVRESASFNLRALRHPLLVLRHFDDIVGNDLALGEEAKQLLITGPNTGGKSALLKAVGLLHLAAYLGLPIPAEGELGYFPSIYAVIGDAQDLQADLSSFSGQMRQVRDILAQVRNDTLVLLDELGNGTDPREGAALAQAVAADLRECGVVTILTSHMAVLKRYALREDGVLLGGMGFDLERLQPTYQLQLGRAGASQGLVIARKIGLPDKVLALAHAIHAGEQENWESWEDRRDSLLRNAEEQAASAQAAAEEQIRLRVQVQKELDKAAALRLRAEEEARKEWQKMLADARVQVRTAIAGLKQGRNTQAATETLDRLDQHLGATSAAEPELPTPGSRGLFLPLRQPVEVRRVDVAGQRLQVDLRGKQLWIPLGQFQADAGLALPREEGRSQYVAPEEHPWQLDLRGQRRDVAEAALLRHLDAAVAAGRNQIEVLHGKGNGVLAELVREFAEQDPRVASWRMARPEQGGGGVSELELR